MAVQLFKKGNSHTVNGVKCDTQIFDEFSFKHMLKEGWCLTPEECYSKKAPEPKIKKAPPAAPVAKKQQVCPKGKTLKAAPPEPEKVSL